MSENVFAVGAFVKVINGYGSQIPGGIINIQKGAVGVIRSISPGAYIAPDPGNREIEFDIASGISISLWINTKYLEVME